MDTLTTPGPNNLDAYWMPFTANRDFKVNAEFISRAEGLYYFTSGAAAKLREGNIRVGGPLTAKGFDTDYSYMLVEIDDQQMHFQVLSRAGKLVDSGSFSPDAVTGGSRSGGARQ